MLTDSPVKYLLFLNTGGSPDFESYFDTLDACLEYSLFCWKRSRDCLSIASIDMKTGTFQTIYDTRKLEHKMEEMQSYDEAMDWQERIHGSYPQQHALRVRDVI